MTSALTQAAASPQPAVNLYEALTRTSLLIRSISDLRGRTR